MADNTLYNKNSIESLDPLSFTRLKPGVYAGDTTYSTQFLVEIISNAVDEYRLGHGTDINVLINQKSVTKTLNSKYLYSISSIMNKTFFMELLYYKKYISIWCQVEYILV